MFRFIRPSIPGTDTEGHPSGSERKEINMSKTQKIELTDLSTSSEGTFCMVECEFVFDGARYECAEYFTVEDGEVTVDDTADSHMRVNGIRNWTEGYMQPFVENSMDRDDYVAWLYNEKQVRDGMQAWLGENTKFRTAWLSKDGQGSYDGDIFNTIDDAQQSLSAWLSELLSMSRDDDDRKGFLDGSFFIETVVDGLSVDSVEHSTRDFHDDLNEAA
jgi:hypothetical protein